MAALQDKMESDSSDTQQQQQQQQQALKALEQAVELARSETEKSEKQLIELRDQHGALVAQGVAQGTERIQGSDSIVGHASFIMSRVGVSGWQ